MRLRLKTINSFTLAVALFLALGGAVYGLTQVTRDVSATVDVQVSTPNGIEIYLDANLTVPANNIAFGTVVVDPFGTPSGQGIAPVPVWVENQSSSTIELTLTDDFDQADVLLTGPNQAPFLQPGEVLPVELLLDFNQGVEGTHPFTMTFQAEGPVSGSAKDKAIAVISAEPETLFWMRTASIDSRHLTDPIHGYIGHLDKHTLELSPTSSITRWEQTAPDEWVFALRPGVAFHDGESWNSGAWQTYAEFAGVPDFGVPAFGFNGPYVVQPIDDLTARIKCGQACPLFARAMNSSQTYSPGPLRTQEFSTITDAIGAGPYQVSERIAGQKIVVTKFKGFVPAPGTPEYSAPILNEIEWQWHSENSARAAMIATGEADWAVGLSIEDAQGLGPDRFATGGTAEIAQFRIDTIWDPWLKEKKMREAVVHAINCQGIVDSFYLGIPSCRGNSGIPGVTGITPGNIQPYGFDPQLSHQLLQEIGYLCGLPNSRADCGAEITITSRPSRIARNMDLVESMVAFMVGVGFNAQANFVEPSIRVAMARCGIGTEGAGGTQVGWQGATEAIAPVCEGGVGPGQILEGIGFGYDLGDYGNFVNRHMLCESGRSTVCVPEKESEWKQATALAGEDRRLALEPIADWQRENVYIWPMFDLFQIYGVNEKLRGFEEPRFDGHTFANLWRFDN